MFENVWLLGPILQTYGSMYGFLVNVWLSGKHMANVCLSVWRKSHTFANVCLFWADLGNVWLNNVYVDDFLFQPL